MTDAILRMAGVSQQYGLGDLPLAIRPPRADPTRRTAIA